MSYNLHNFDTVEHPKKFNLLPQSLKNRLIFLPNDTIIDINLRDPSLNQHQNHQNILQIIRGWVPAPDHVHNPETDQWIWTGTYTGKNNSASYQNQSLIRLLYKHFINADLPDKKRLTTFSTTSIYDVNPYKISTSFTTRSSHQFRLNLRKEINKELPDMPFNKPTPSSLVQELDKASFEYRDISDCLKESGFIEMGISCKDMAIDYLNSEGFNPIHSKQIVDEMIK